MIDKIVYLSECDAGTSALYTRKPNRNRAPKERATLPIFPQSAIIKGLIRISGTIEGRKPWQRKTRIVRQR